MAAHSQQFPERVHAALLARDSDHLRAAARTGRPDLQGDLDVDQLLGGEFFGHHRQVKRIRPEVLTDPNGQPTVLRTVLGELVDDAQQSRQALREQAHFGGRYNGFNIVGLLSAHPRQGSGRPRTVDWQFILRAGWERSGTTA